MILAIADDAGQDEFTPLERLLRLVEPWQLLVGGLALASLYGLGFVLIYLDLVYEHLGAGGAQPSIPQADLWPRALFWGTVHLCGLAASYASFWLARHGKRFSRILVLQLSTLILIILAGGGAIRLPGGGTFIAIGSTWLLASLGGLLASRLPWSRAKRTENREELSWSEVWRGGLVILAFFFLSGAAFAAFNASLAVSAIRTDRRPISYFLVLPVRKVNLIITDDRIGQAIGIPNNIGQPATLLGQRDGRVTLMLRSDRRVIDVPASGVILTSRE